MYSLWLPHPLFPEVTGFPLGTVMPLWVTYDEAGGAFPPSYFVESFLFLSIYSLALWQVDFRILGFPRAPWIEISLPQSEESKLHWTHKLCNNWCFSQLNQPDRFLFQRDILKQEPQVGQFSFLVTKYLQSLTLLTHAKEAYCYQVLCYKMSAQ